MCGNKMIAEGLPVPVRRERDVSSGLQDILSGKDFLSVFLRSSAPPHYREYHDSEEKLQSPYEQIINFDNRNQAVADTSSETSTLGFEETTIYDSYVRTSRDTISSPQYSYQSTESSSTSINNLVSLSTSDFPSSESVIVAVRVSSSVDRQINKNSQFKPITETLQTSSELSESDISANSRAALNLSGSANSNAQKSVITTINTNLDNAQTLNNDYLDSNNYINHNSGITNLQSIPSGQNDSSGSTFEQNTLNNSVFVSKHQPSLIAHAIKSELSIDEAEPVTHNRENRDNRDISAIQPSAGYSSNLQQPRNYPALFQNVPTGANIPFNFSDFLKSNEKASQLHPFHHSFIYHDNPQDPGRARSVSYSTLIQAVDPRQEKTITPETGDGNRFGQLNDSNKNQLPQDYADTPLSSTNAPSGVSSSTRISLVLGQHKDAQSYSVQYDSSSSKISDGSYSDGNKWLSSYSSTSSQTSTEVTEINNINQWGKFFTPSGRGNPQQNPSKIYGRPEQNYEIDEAVSVHTNGRTHGIQAGAKDAQPDTTTKSNVDGKDSVKDKKTGYIVEGRNYRRYRVEEKTPDGFIVGEYGVVSNDDGSLRGVRYTADGSINPSVIYNALMKFLSL